MDEPIERWMRVGGEMIRIPLPKSSEIAAAIEADVPFVDAGTVRFMPKIAAWGGMILSAMLICGCLSDTAPVKPDTKPDIPVVTDQLDTAALADALAKEAEFDGGPKGIGFEATETLDGLLNKLTDRGVPQKFVDDVRAAVPAIGSKPPRDLKVEEITALRGVR